MTNNKIEKSKDENKKGTHKSKSYKIRKKLITTLSVLVLLVAFIIIFISHIAKYLIEKYDIKFTGREITINYAYVNPFTGFVYLDNFKSYELKSDSLFLSADGVSANLSMLKLFSKTYEISELVLNQPKGMIIQNGDKHDLNFMDIIEKFTSKKTGIPKTPVHFSILKLKIKDGQFFYRENVIPVNYFIKQVNIECGGIHWDSDTIPFKFSFVPGIGGGEIKGDFTVNSKTLDYHAAVVANKFDLKVLEQYIKDMSNYGSFAAILNANIKAKGNFKDKENITAQGMIEIDDFHFGKNPKDDYASFENVVIKINELSPKFHKYSFDSISINHPYFKYEKYDHLDNIQTMFGKNGSHITEVAENTEKFNLVVEIARYVKVLAKNFFKSNYKINRFAIYGGDLRYNDYSLNEKFSVDLSPIYVVADSITKSKNRVSLTLKSGIKPFGNLSLDLSINPKDSSDFDLNYHLQKIPASLLNPYLIMYTEFPLNRGTLELKGKWSVRNGMIKSNNHIVLIDPRLNNRIKNKNTKWIPMKVLMFFVREQGNVIDYEVPITGNLKDPKFHWRDVIIDGLTNIFVKPATTPYRMEVKNVETEIEESFSLKWEMRNSQLTSNQETFLEYLADFIHKNPEVSITVNPQNYELKEKEYILFFEAKKKYYMKCSGKNNHSFNEEDSLKVEKMSIKDSLFTKYLNEKANDAMLFTVQDKCIKLLDSTVIEYKFNVLNKKRLNMFMSYFKENGTEKHVKILAKKTVIPYNGFSFYKIHYNGSYPDYFLKAYNKMNELNNETPRNKFKKERRKIGTYNKVR
jgi:hypothetical protein